MKQKSNNFKYLLIIVALVFLVANAVLLLIGNVLSTDISAPAVIISWIFMALGFGLFIVLSRVCFTSSKMMNARFLGIAIIKYGVIYLIVDLAFAIITMILSAFFDVKWVWCLLIQLIALLAFAAFIVLCIASKEQIEDVSTRIEQKTSYMRMIKADAATLPNYCQEAESRAAFEEFAEAVKYSDPVSFEALEEIEQKLAEIMSKMKQELIENDIENAKADCKTAMLILKERNTKSKALKPRH